MTSARTRIVAIAAITVVAAGCGRGDDSTSGVEVSDAWARPTPAGTTTSAVYMTLHAGDDDGLIGVSVDSAVAAIAMAHDTTSTGGQMSMDHTPGVELPAGEDVRFEPGRHHVMLEGLAAPLVAGDTFEVTLDFEHAPDATVAVDVRDDR